MRLEASQDTFSIKDDQSILEFKNTDMYFHIKLDREPRNIYFGTNTHTGEYLMSCWFFRDKPLKRLVKQLVNYKKTFADTKAMNAFYKTFPEALNKEFNKQILEDKPQS